MRNRIFIAGILFATCLLPTVWANSEVSQEKKEEVRYRLVEWQTKHVHETDQAEKIAKTLTDLKCEVKKEQHNGHVDLKFRCPEWRRMLLESHDDAHKWEKWLKTYGFETQHNH